MKLMQKILISRILLKMNLVLQFLILMKSFQSALIKLTIECFEIVNISFRASFCLQLVIDDSSCTLYKHVVMLFYIFFLGGRGSQKNVT